MLLLVSVGLSDAQNSLKFSHLTREQGLSQNSVYTILQDSQGFMWFGTRFGLNRYDGVEFKTFLFDPLNENSLPGYLVTTLCEDQDGDLWIGTSTGGIARYDRVKEDFTIYRNDPNDPNTLVHNAVTSIFCESSGRLWIGTEQGLSRFDKSTGSFTNFRHHPGAELFITQERITAITEIPHGTLWVGMEDGSLLKILTASMDITTVIDPSLVTGIEIRDLFPDYSNQCLWVARFAQGLIKLDIPSETLSIMRVAFSDASTNMNGVSTISQSLDGRLWIGTVAGLSVFDPFDESYDFYFSDASDPASLNDDIIHVSFVDPQGSVWLGTESGGVNRYDPDRIRIGLLQHEAGNPNSIRANGGFSITEDSVGNIWFGTMPGGTSVLDPGTGEFKHYNTIGQNASWSKDYISRVRPDHKDRVWIGTYQCGLFILDRSTQHFTHYANDENDSSSLGDKTIKDILESRDGSIWLATETQGLDRYDEVTDSFVHFRHDPGNSNSLSSDFLYCLLEDRAGYIWIGTRDGGLNRFDRNTGLFQRFHVDRHKQNSLSSDCVISLYEDDDEYLWIGTRSGGLNRLDPARERITILDLKTEPMNLSVYGILQDDHKNLWLSSNMGILKVHPEKGLINTFGMSDGVQEDFYFSSCVKDRQGNMYFGGSSGFNVFHPDSLRYNANIPPVVLTALSINYKVVPIGKPVNERLILSESLTHTEELQLIYTDKVINFEFAALSYPASFKNQYSYMLDGYDETWIDAGSRNAAQYMNIPSGNYTFRVRGSNNDGVWNLEGSAIKVHIAPPFWRTWWFRILTVVALISFIFLYIRIRTVRLIKQRNKLEDLVKERTALLKIEIEERQRIELEKSGLELDHLKRELLTQSLHINDKQQVMDDLQEELEKFTAMKTEDLKPGIRKLIRYVQKRSGVKQGLKDFELWFTEVHTGFYTALREAYPELTENELKVCALLRLNLNSKDISKVMNVQSSTVDIYRHRIRKKSGLGNEENLSSFLANF